MERIRSLAALPTRNSRLCGKRPERLHTGKLVRIYPVTRRCMKEPFKSYQWIEGEVDQNTSDFRPESFKVRQDTITVGETVELRSLSTLPER
jgi:hypothetical protein